MSWIFTHNDEQIHSWLIHFPYFLIIIHKGENKQVTSSYNIFDFLNFSYVCLFTVWCDVDLHVGLRAFFSVHAHHTQKGSAQKCYERILLDIMYETKPCDSLVRSEDDRCSIAFAANVRMAAAACLARRWMGVETALSTIVENKCWKERKYRFVNVYMLMN